ncbi:histidine phosphatase family protein [Flavobacterium sp. GT3R68]|uniref:SixA phosphatase family protein n=1 Tax=Flavobacterium sp. GT3R68 TaxID=2594437 RepID=UPI000F868BAE|nr:histidine phosphatase family protein [Flavobacterium sp. GT3R68]RTY94925.1 histidine phosphatase family protein [Flavobacterium sp. GSN2]TRW91729.1 histidine phosphatase family protein [Flavobacterium sp. GT3R68]
MRKLILVRHAKSSWLTSHEDKDRPLASRGIKDVNLVSSKAKEILPKKILIWSSTAKRAMDTGSIFTQNIGIPVENIIFRDDLYTFDAKQLEKIIKSCDNKNENLILFGHNEAITHFVNKFGDVSIDNVPTSGLVSIIFDTDTWENINKGKIEKFIFPRDLKS